ncbi:MAG TPA: hypothetical protein VFW11_21305 [Cyclobacteriaceae bacterium]|nr:hypothetical protein [Cyclobacteriaceae bacterium]
MRDNLENNQPPVLFKLVQRSREHFFAGQLCTCPNKYLGYSYAVYLFENHNFHDCGYRIERRLSPCEEPRANHRREKNAIQVGAGVPEASSWLVPFINIHFYEPE